MTLITAIGRIMQNNGILRGDTDAPTTLNDLQHGATINTAKNAIQDELIDLVADIALPYEHAGTGSIVTVASTRSYALPSDFVRFFGKASLYYAAGNRRLYEYNGGEEALQQTFYDYKTATGDPSHWYFDATTTKKIAFWPVPQDAKTYTFDYNKDVSVTNSTDTLPFHNEIEAQAFCRLASRRFKFMFEGKDVADLLKDADYLRAKSTVMNLVTGKNPPGRWAPIYR